MNITFSEFAKYLAFEQLEPYPEYRNEWMLGSIVVHLAKMLGGKNIDIDNITLSGLLGKASEIPQEPADLDSQLRAVFGAMSKDNGTS